jgi:hypothetical protein
MLRNFLSRLLALLRSHVANSRKRLRRLRVRCVDWTKRLRVRSRYSAMRFWGATREGGSDSIRFDRFGLANCEIRYINLRHRQDRNRRIRNEFRRLGIETPTRIEAFTENYGALGCAKSHVEALMTPAEDHKLLMICEDDLIFSSARTEIDAHVEAFRKDHGVDILCLAYNLVAPPIRASEELSLTTGTQTTACYLVKERARLTLLAVFEQSVQELSTGSDARKSAIDVSWRRLQSGVLVFGVPNRRLCSQGASYSDVERRVVDYGV